MTVIAFDGRYVAADKQATIGTSKSIATKLFRWDDKVFAVDGSAAHGMMLIAWLQGGAKPAEFPAPKGDSDFAHVHVFERGKPVRVYEGYPVPVIYEDSYYAAGSGSDLAMGAMAMGADARKAVEVANTWGVGCGMGVTVFDLWEEISADQSVRAPAALADGSAAAAPVGT